MALDGHRLALQLAEGDGVCAGGQRGTCGGGGARDMSSSRKRSSFINVFYLSRCKS